MVATVNPGHLEAKIFHEMFPLFQTIFVSLLNPNAPNQVYLPTEVCWSISELKLTVKVLPPNNFYHSAGKRDRCFYDGTT